MQVADVEAALKPAPCSSQSTEAEHDDTRAYSTSSSDYAHSWSGGRCLTGVGSGRRRASTAPSLAATKAHGEHEDGEEDLCAEAGQGGARR